ncbi:mitochondrial matrix Mmp37-domain-containing protein [Scheffersomyces amazonensis]|uniref:mitochondrial matrix Mmp37-domain-containing protein n=1 Tax=Scheffersomyces amazonensis TaxID=1078765 RepID=UPI00315C6105
MITVIRRGRWIFKQIYRFNSNSTVRPSGTNSNSANSSGYTFTSYTTPYNDKFYQPIISEGYRGFDKLIIPKDFQAKNQEIEFDGLVQQQELREIAESFNFEQSPIKVSIGYGSGVFPQNGYNNTPEEGDKLSVKTEEEETQIDLINVVKDNQTFHRYNLQRHRDHYSIKSLPIIKFIQGRDGIYFNPFVKLKGHLIKYGIISSGAAQMDLMEWSSLYFAGRLQKPVNYIRLDEDEGQMIKFLNQYNLKNAMTVGIILLQEQQFNEQELYEQITRISYMGDFRTYVGGENPNKVKNIVEKQLKYFKSLYEPILQYFIHKNYLIIVDNNEEQKVFKKNLNINNKINLISTLPLNFRIQLYQMYQDKSLKEIAKDKDLPLKIIKLIQRVVRNSSIKQAIMGIFSSGIIKSIKYAFAKQVKYWRAR